MPHDIIQVCQIQIRSPFFALTTKYMGLSGRTFKRYPKLIPIDRGNHVSYASVYSESSARITRYRTKHQHI
jgi:hypothetical protein